MAKFVIVPLESEFIPRSVSRIVRFAPELQFAGTPMLDVVRVVMLKLVFVF